MTKAYNKSVFHFELVALVALLILFFSFLSNGWVDTNELQAAWFMPLLGIVAATIAMSTPAGGGVVFFPAMVLLGVPPIEAVAFSVGAQSVGMGIFGAFNWIKRDRSSINFYIVIPTAIIGSAVSLIALFIFPIVEAKLLQLTFSLFGVGLATYVLYNLRKDLDKQNNLFQWSKWMVLAVVVVGLIGGLLVGYIGVGIDAILFLILTSRFKMDVHQATVTSIITMGLTAMTPFVVHLFIIRDVPINLWLMALPGILIGARIGPWLNQTLGNRRILIGFATVLIIEFLMTISKFTLLE
ncbi:MAG: sulfite exporter TauE/SafE family protein [Flavobacteriales bacterium]|nr:sulfite exporter TauE/SafE family protein [Flavobacteriales bacterium]